MLHPEDLMEAKEKHIQRKYQVCANCCAGKLQTIRFNKKCNLINGKRSPSIDYCSGDISSHTHSSYHFTLIIITCISFT